ncbi:MAG: hypothetical protein M0Q12_05715 [Synergistaceae bacterium]|jgi:hypothetical protein|nr:hypothetical protein [Synergistaceae bacterium]
MTTIPTLSNININSLDEKTFIAGTYQELPFDVFDSYGNPINISTFTCTWVLSPFGQPNTVSLSKTGEYQAGYATHNRFIVCLYSTDTASLSGKYVQQPIVTGNPGYEFRMGQGYVNIIDAIA